MITDAAETRQKIIPGNLQNKSYPLFLVKNKNLLYHETKKILTFLLHVSGGNQLKW
jgi:hypothetical protein